MVILCSSIHGIFCMAKASLNRHQSKWVRTHLKSFILIYLSFIHLILITSCLSWLISYKKQLKEKGSILAHGLGDTVCHSKEGHIVRQLVSLHPQLRSTEIWKSVFSLFSSFLFVYGLGSELKDGIAHIQGTSFRLQLYLSGNVFRHTQGCDAKSSQLGQSNLTITSPNPQTIVLGFSAWNWGTQLRTLTFLSTFLSLSSLWHSALAHLLSSFA